MVRLVGTIPRVQALFVNPVIVGGLAVLCRLGVAYRSTQDLDTLLRRLEGQPSGLEILERAGATSLDNLGATLPTERGDVRVDVLEARDSELDRDFTDRTDRLEAMAHRWALATATPVRIGATSMDDAWRHAELKFERRATRTLRLIRNLGRADVDAELIAATADFLRGTMVRGDSRP